MLRNNDRECLLKRVQIYSFAVVEATLFLDTHPTDKEALRYFHKYNKLRSEAVEEYEKQFGPLTLGDYEPEGRWTWVDDPWPWEMEA